MLPNTTGISRYLVYDVMQELFKSTTADHDQAGVRLLSPLWHILSELQESLSTSLLPLKCGQMERALNLPRTAFTRTAVAVVVSAFDRGRWQ